MMRITGDEAMEGAVARELRQGAEFLPLPVTSDRKGIATVHGT